MIEVTILMAFGEGNSLLISKIHIISSNYQFQFKIFQFVISIYLAVTISKFHGKTLRQAGVDLSKICFIHGQYFAFS